MPTISKLFDSRAEAARAATDLVAAGVPRVQIAVIGPYSDELAGLWAFPGAILGAAAGGFVWLGALHSIDPFAAGLSATALLGAVCGGLAGGLLGAFATAALKPDKAGTAEGIILVTAQVDDDETEIAQAVLGVYIPTTALAAAAA